MKTSEAGKALIRNFEGVVLKVYADPATGGEPWTAGVGHCGPDVHPGMKVTREMADTWLTADLAKFEAVVNKAAPACTQGQFDALVAFCFNVGPGNFLKSTLLKKHNAGLYGAAALEFGKWNKGAGKVMAGLTRRRAAEAALYRGVA